MSTTKLTINKNGSIKIEGDFEITDCNGQTYGLEGRTALGFAVVVYLPTNLLRWSTPQRL
jgi:hypothetical protein